MTTRINTNQISGLQTIYAADYGAVAGADNTAAIRLAIADIVSGDGTRLIIPESLISDKIEIDKDNVIVESNGASMTFATNYAWTVTADPWGYPPILFVASGDDVTFQNMSFYQGLYTFAGSFIWLGGADGLVQNCKFNDLPYIVGSVVTTGDITVGTTSLVVASATNILVGDLISIAGVTGGVSGTNLVTNVVGTTVTIATPSDATVVGAAVALFANVVAIQSGSSLSGNKVLNCNFFQCWGGAVSLHGSNGLIEGCTAYLAAGGNTRVANTCDQMFGVDGVTKTNIIDTNVIRSGLLAPIAGADIGVNTPSTEFIVSGCTVTGINGGRGIYIKGSSYGVVSNNIVDGLDGVATAAWLMMEIDVGSNQVVVSNNVLKSPPLSGTAGFGLYVSPAGNIVEGNIFALGSSGTVTAAMRVIAATSPGTIQICNNKMTNSGRGIYFVGITDNDLYPIILRGNVYDGPQDTPLSHDGSMLGNCPVWLYDEQFYGASINRATFNTPKIGRAARAGYGHLFPMAVGKHTVLYASEVPDVTNWSGETWYAGDRVYHSIPAAGSPIGWICTVGGTFSAATEAGTSTSGSAVVTGLADTSDFFPGDLVDATAGFAVLTRLTILSIVDNTSITVDRSANASGACTLATVDSTWVAMANL